MNRQESELTVITRAKELLLYVLAVTDKSPKKFRFTLVSRLQGYSIDIVEYLYMVNYINVSKGVNPDGIRERLDYQRRAMARCRLLAYMSVIAGESICITPKQQRIISEKLIEVEKMLYAWQQSDIRRL